MRRVAITGLGTKNPLALDPAKTFDALLAGDSGVTKTDFGEGVPVSAAAPVTGFTKEDVFGKRAKRYARYTALYVAAARDAIADAGLGDARYPADRVATITGVGVGGIEYLLDQNAVLLDRGARRVAPYSVAATIPSAASGVVSIEGGFAGPCFSISSACASSAHAIGESFEMIRSGRADAAVTGGAEAAVIQVAAAAYSRMGALTENADPQTASRPFDRDRDGFVLAEGASALVLESWESAMKRNASIYAELVGYGASADAFHETEPDREGRGAVLAMRKALACAGLDPSDVQYVNAHGTSTRFNDRIETLALRQVFGGSADGLVVSAPKSMVGHMQGGAGAFEAIVTALSLQRGEITPTINLDNPDPECDLDYVPHEARRQACRVGISNSFGFGGQNACLVFQRA